MFEKVLVAIDLVNEPADLLLEHAAGLRADPPEIFVAHVVEPQYVQYSIDPTFTGSLTQRMEEDALASARQRVGEICERHGIPADHQRIILGRAAERIHELASELGVDTIVVGSNTRPRWMRMLGSTANAILHSSPVNVIVINNPTGEIS
jgi:universal stress protein A